jgi:3-methyl-2-oxobutanoate hydroxymethyltransferase
MSVTQAIKRKSIRDVRKGGEPIVFLTAYTAPMARFLDPHVDVLLVGDSLGMVLYGLDSTLAVTLDMMIAHGAAVVRGSEHACVIVDMPFGSYQESPVQAFRNAARILAQTGCAGVKLEGGTEVADTIRFLVGRGIPVCGHIGLLPQSVNAAGGFRTHGRDEAEAARIADDARAVADAGAFAIVIEGTLEPLARAITEEIAVPTIGIGASPACDGQVLVTEDILGLFADFTPRFVRRYADLGPEVSAAAAAYAADVRARRFPGPEHTVGAAPKAKTVTGAPSGTPRAGRRAAGA